MTAEICNTCEMMGLAVCRLEGRNLKALMIQAKGRDKTCPNLADLIKASQDSNGQPVENPIDVYLNHQNIDPSLVMVTGEVVHLRATYPQSMTENDSRDWRKGYGDIFDKHNINPSDKRFKKVMGVVRRFVRENRALLPDYNREPSIQDRKVLQEIVGASEFSDLERPLPDMPPDAAIDIEISRDKISRIQNYRIQKLLIEALNIRRSVSPNIDLDDEQKEAWKVREDSIRQNPDYSYSEKVTALSALNIIISESRNKALRLPTEDN